MHAQFKRNFHTWLRLFQILYMEVINIYSFSYYKSNELSNVAYDEKYAYYEAHSLRISRIDWVESCKGLRYESFGIVLLRQYSKYFSISVVKAFQAGTRGKVLVKDKKYGFFTHKYITT